MLFNEYEWASEKLISTSLLSSLLFALPVWISEFLNLEIAHTTHFISYTIEFSHSNVFFFCVNKIWIFIIWFDNKVSLHWMNQQVLITIYNLRDENRQVRGKNKSMSREIFSHSHFNESITCEFRMGKIILDFFFHPMNIIIFIFKNTQKKVDH